MACNEDCMHCSKDCGIEGLAESEKPEMEEIEIELDADQLEYIEKNNIDLSKFVHELIEEEIMKTRTEEIAKLRELMKKYPEIVKEESE